MKNIITIDLDSNCHCDCITNIDDADNSINLELIHIGYVNPVINITLVDGTTITSADYTMDGSLHRNLHYTIPIEHWNTDGEITLWITDGTFTSDKIIFICKQVIDNQKIIVKKINENYTICPFTVVSLQEQITELNSKINYDSSKHILVGRWGGSWNLSTTVQNIGSNKDAVDNEYYKSTTGANATVTIKKAGLYYVSMYAQGSVASGASAGIVMQVISNNVIVDDKYVLFGKQYTYGGFSVDLNAGRVVYLPAGTVLTPQLGKSDSSGTTTTTGSSYMEVVHIY